MSAEYSADVLSEIEKLAESLTPLSDIAVLTGVSEDMLREAVSLRSSDASKSYRRGKARCALELRRLDIELALSGSPTAAQAIGGYIQKMLSDEID